MNHDFAMTLGGFRGRLKPEAAGIPPTLPATRPQHALDAAAVVVEAATTSAPRFRWQTSEQAATFASLSLADVDGTKTVSAMDTLFLGGSGH